MTQIRVDVADLLRQGAGVARTATELHVSRAAVAAARGALAIPANRPGPALTPLPDLFWARTQAVAGGHLEWTGHRNRAGSPVVSWKSAYRIAFGIAHDREPEGRVRAGCEYPGCVAPAHVEDAVLRQRTRAALAAVTGRVARMQCQHGAEYVGYRGDGRAYCRHNDHGQHQTTEPTNSQEPRNA